MSRPGSSLPGWFLPAMSSPRPGEDVSLGGHLHQQLARAANRARPYLAAALDDYHMVRGGVRLAPAARRVGVCRQPDSGERSPGLCFGDRDDCCRRCHGPIAGKRTGHRPLSNPPLRPREADGPSPHLDNLTAYARDHGIVLIAKTKPAAHYLQALSGIYTVALVGARVHLCVDSQLSRG